MEGNKAAYYLNYTESEEDEYPYFMYLDEEVSYWHNSDPDNKLTIRCVKGKRKRIPNKKSPLFIVIDRKAIVILCDCFFYQKKPFVLTL